MHRLVCDRVVWLHLLKQTAVFSKEKLKELVSFVRENRRSELMPEVLRAAASKFPPSDPRRKRSTVRIIWTVQGWAAPETMDMEGYVGHGDNNFTYSNVEELKNVAKAVGINFSIVEVQGFDSPLHFTACFRTTCNNFKMIADHVEQQDEKLANFEVIELGMSHSLNENFFSLLRMSMKWKVQEVVAVVDSLPNRPMIKLDHLAGSSLLDKGHIGILFVDWYNLEPMSLNTLKRVWEISDEMYINEKVKLKGGSGEDREAAWQHVTDYLLRINGNTID